ncbi:hypothetical protein Salat_2777100 [Sesamum alatum]|uniref:Uncharacterized protein n=1 Tax=Sesamum alatum TaxID=300844 RepID=A0AAE2C971_9LAMI|nr:hypothetical protein Salat_2777100 [Sesamum alatum]
MVMIRAERHLKMPPLPTTLNHLESREFTVCIEQNPPQPEEVAVECGLSKEKGMKHISDSNDFEFLGSGVGDNGMQHSDSLEEGDDDDSDSLETEANIQQPILPPIVPDEVTNQAEGSTENMSQTILTEPRPHVTQVSQQGPSMYEQLQMGQNTMPMPPQTSLQPKLNIRAPPPMTGQAFMPCFSNRPINPDSKTIIQEHGQKFVELSKWPTSAKKK